MTCHKANHKNEKVALNSGIMRNLEQFITAVVLSQIIFHRLNDENHLTPFIYFHHLISTQVLTVSI